MAEAAARGACGRPSPEFQGGEVMGELDTSQWADEYAKHVDRWLAGQESLISVSDFLAQKIAAHLVDEALAEQGWLAA